MSQSNPPIKHSKPELTKAPTGFFLQVGTEKVKIPPSLIPLQRAYQTLTQADQNTQSDTAIDSVEEAIWHALDAWWKNSLQRIVDEQVSMEACDE